MNVKTPFFITDLFEKTFGMKGVRLYFCTPFRKALNDKRLIS